MLRPDVRAAKEAERDILRARAAELEAEIARDKAEHSKARWAALLRRPSTPPENPPCPSLPRGDE